MVSTFCNLRDRIYTTDRSTEALYWHFTVISWHTRCVHTETDNNSLNVDQKLIQEALSDGESRWYGVKFSWFRRHLRINPATTNVTNDKLRWLGIYFFSRVQYFCFMNWPDPLKLGRKLFAKHFILTQIIFINHSHWLKHFTKKAIVFMWVGQKVKKKQSRYRPELV
jgi:hypothetical protein